jgi:hypothetical protein
VSPRRARSALIETAELLTVGAAITLVAAVTVLLVAQASRYMALDALAMEGSNYLRSEPVRGVVLIGSTLLLSHLAAWAAARFVYYRGSPASLRPELSVWFQVLHVHNRAQEPMDRRFVTAELRDGRRVAGYALAYTLDADAANRELALVAPIFAQRTAAEPPELIPDDYIVLSASEIVYFSVQQQSQPRT